MPSTAIVTLVRMLEGLPETTQNRIVEHLREYIEDLQDEARWENTFKKTQTKLSAAARQAKEKSPKGKQNRWTSTNYEVKYSALLPGLRIGYWIRLSNAR